MLFQKKIPFGLFFKNLKIKKCIFKIYLYKNKYNKLKVESYRTILYFTKATISLCDRDCRSKNVCHLA